MVGSDTRHNESDEEIREPRRERAFVTIEAHACLQGCRNERLGVEDDDGFFAKVSRTKVYHISALY